MVIKYTKDNPDRIPARPYTDICDGIIELHLDEAFQVDKKGKLVKVTRGRKLIQLILDVGSDENMFELHSYLYALDKEWFHEYLKIKYRRVDKKEAKIQAELVTYFK